MTDVELPTSAIVLDKPPEQQTPDAKAEPSVDGEGDTIDAITRRGPRVRDDVFWTELEIRRLSNLVAEAIHSARYVGSSPQAREQREKMRVYIEAMKRKAMRVLLRAEQCVGARGGHAVWPGIDATIVDPVSLAEEYVKLVEDYLGVLEAEEEEQRARVEEEEEMSDVVGEEDVGGEGDETVGNVGKREDWEVDDDMAYREALRQQRGDSTAQAKSDNEQREREQQEQHRHSLLEGAEGVRRRRETSSSSVAAGTDTGNAKADEEVMRKQRPIQDDLTSNLVDLVGQLKESVTVNKHLLDKDNKVLDETDEAVDRNVDRVGKQRVGLRKFTQTAATSWWLLLGAALVIVVVFLFMLLLLNVPGLR